MNENRRKYNKALSFIFIGLLCSTFSLNLFDIFGVSSGVYLTVIGFIFIIAGVLKMKDIFTNHKTTIIFLGITIALTIVSVVYDMIFPVVIPDVSEITDSSILELIDDSVFTAFYISTVISILYTVFEILAVYQVLKGIKKYCDQYCTTYSEDGAKRTRRYRNLSIFKAIATILLLFASLPVMRAYNEYVGGTIQLEDLVASSSSMVLITLVAMVAFICYFVMMIKTLVYVYRVSNTNPTLPIIQDENIIDVPAEEKKDPWDEIK